MLSGMKRLTRRDFLAQAGCAAVIGLGVGTLSAAISPNEKRKMTIDLVCGSIGVSANQVDAIDLAARNGFESVGADGAYLAKLSPQELADLLENMKTRRIVFGAAGLPVDFRQDELRFRESMRGLEQIALGLKRAGVDRMTTWLTPSHGELTYMQNFRQHAARLRQIANLLKDSGVRLGLEYVGPKTSWSSRRYPFIHTLAEMKELISEIGTGNVGYLLDSWHWWHAGDTLDDILTLRPADVVAVDLNDAPADVPKDQQPDGKRELPCATGVIDVAPFLGALQRLGYDGPVRAEPFNQALRAMPREEAVAATARALKKAFASLPPRS